MPELPEVEVVRRELAERLTGARVDRVLVPDARGITRHQARQGDFIPLLQGARLLAPERRGKFLWFPLGGGSADLALLAHLGMSGQLLLADSASSPVAKHTRVSITLRPARSGVVRLDFVDQRTFGSLAVDQLVDGTPSQVSHIALDPLDPKFDAGLFTRRVRASSRQIKTLLLDQKVVSGIGNIYADESLWAARINARVPGAELSTTRLRSLLAAVRSVFGAALAAGGTTFDGLYRRVNGESGYFARELNVYGREGEGCPRCGTVIVREAYQNRSSHYCPRCQPMASGSG